jgi:hypothetical protein
MKSSTRRMIRLGLFEKPRELGRRRALCLFGRRRSTEHIPWSVRDSIHSFDTAHHLIKNHLLQKIRFRVNRRMPKLSDQAIPRDCGCYRTTQSDPPVFLTWNHRIYISATVLSSTINRENQTKDQRTLLAPEVGTSAFCASAPSVIRISGAANDS